MKKISKVSLTMLVLTLGIFVAAGTANAAVCDGDFSDATDCGCVAMSNVTFSADVTCSTRHGLIIGASGITINGAGFTLSGGGVLGPDGLPGTADDRNCEVLTADEGVPERQWCDGHPCRQASDGNVLDSGIVNANTSLEVSCNPAAPMGQGGCDGLTVKNLEITGWCDGIFISGDCDTGLASVHTRGTGYGDNAEYRLTGLLIEGNEIHDNGMDGCGTYTPNTNSTDPGDGGDWEHRYYNDAIFTAQIGLDAVNCPGAWGADGLPVPNTNPANPGIWPYFAWWEGFPVSECNPNRIIHNKTYDQKGCACVSCPGGNGINLQGGLEVDPVDWSGANVIGNNLCKNCAISGISYHHATKHNRIHDNYLVENQFGAITNACGWGHDNYIFGNNAEDNYGMGIGVNSKATIANNYCVETHAVTDANLQLLGWPCAGHGILLGGDAGGSELVGNVCCLGQSHDILDGSGTAIGEKNRCDDSAGFTPGCEFACCEPFFSLCTGDLNYDCRVNRRDSRIVNSQMGSGSAICCP